MIAFHWAKRKVSKQSSYKFKEKQRDETTSPPILTGNNFSCLRFFFYFASFHLTKKWTHQSIEKFCYKSEDIWYIVKRCGVSTVLIT